MEWKRGPVIGQGSTATVHLATTSTGDQFAVKSSTLSTSVFLQKEQQFLSQLNSPHVISYKGFAIHHENNKAIYNLFMEYAPGGTISEMIKKSRGFLKESKIRYYTKQILMGLDHMHLNNIVHCDIKCENILVCENGVKIGDLGCSKWAENRGSSSYSVFSGTPVFMAPEVARGEVQGFEADVWAVGCVVIEMATGFNPWPEMNDPVSGLYKIGFSGEIPEFPQGLSPEGQDFLKKCLKVDAKERWTVKELLRHPFVCNLNPVFETKNSPTSILDQDFWHCLEIPEISPESTQVVEFSGESPVERMRQLIDNATSSCLPNWKDEKDWIIVRSNDIEESSKISQSGYNNESPSTESTRIESCSYSKIHEMSVLMLENDDVIGANESVTNGFVSRHFDFVKISDDTYLLLGLNLLIFDIFIKCNVVFLNIHTFIIILIVYIS
uniref:mitogen-activated protein kinase kinase kinase 18-like n=1 Tax=Erigeron canadensis TaxID=72917 RepID=UPI001CB99349|nr:mitogen-activated protein kinase kinase kinase 18-like [Erigeron canadensis]